MIVMAFLLGVQPIQMSVDATNPVTIPLLIVTGLILAAIKRLWPRRLAMCSIPLAGVYLIAAFTISLLLPLWALNFVIPDVVHAAVPNLWITLAYWLLLGMGTSIPSMLEQLGDRMPSTPSRASRSSRRWRRGSAASCG